MRRLYRERLVGLIKRGDLPSVLRSGLRYAGVRLGSFVGRPLGGPILGTMVTNYACNLRCTMCDLPLRVGRYKDEGLEPLSTSEMLEVIDGFAALGTLGLGFTGGEPLLRKDIRDLLARSKKRRLVTHLNTNGTFLDGDLARWLVERGVDSVNLSLDGATRATHDRIRSKDGSFEEVAVACEELVRARGRGSLPRIKLVMVLSPGNRDEARQLLALRRALGADAVDFIPLHDFDSPGSERERPVPTEGETVGEHDGWDDLARELRAASKTEPLDNSDEHLALLPRALRGLPSPIRCTAGYNSLVVDLYGRIFPCVPWSNADRPTGSVREASLPSYWRSKGARKGREDASRCRACYLNCQTELNLLFDGKGRRKARNIDHPTRRDTPWRDGSTGSTTAPAETPAPGLRSS